ncbi:hypothetical protein MANES_02G203175v8 [Manihot esculenta]|uniref:Uncharacterized protein n=1 Tax=Manihot esculenta TaxID=3983 RepID=A0ACB7I758_MANES|nr:hypothetical protein MANES_02G203175v8 [Manihot esculenta]
MIENEEVDNYSAEITGWTGTEAEEEEYHLEKKPSPEDEKVDQKLRKLREQLLAELGKKDQSQTSLPIFFPFSKWVQQETVPKKFMMPSMAAYDGTGNSREHVMNYKTFMELQTLLDALMCKVFPMTLLGPARAWFNSLEAGSIRSFGDLAIRFINRFIAGVPAERKTSYLETVRQREGEYLREYVAHFNTEALQIPDLDEGRAVEAMQKGTTSAEFFGSLSRKPPTSLAELMQRAEKYIRQDDALVTSRFAKRMTGKEKASEEKRSERHEKKHGKRLEPYKQAWERRDQRPPPPRVLEPRLPPPWVPEKPTPLNASRAEVLMAVQDKEFLQWPKPMKSEADQRNPDKYCQYHRTHGHDTNNCFQLIAEIERLIKRGHLKNFVKKSEGQKPQSSSAVQMPRRTGAGPVNDGSSGTINMIVGGTGGRMGRRGKKRNREGESSSTEVMQIVDHSPLTITFSSEDAQGIQMPHDDALVIEAVIHNYRVKKVLVDDGSKVNLLPYRVFQQMGIPDEQLVRDQAPIKGIGGVPVLVEGKVKLALTLGEAPRTRTHHEVFLVVKLPLSYNVILGRPALFNFEAVTSIRYLALKFPTEEGVGIVRGSQEEARAVYLATVAEPSSTGKTLDPEVLEVRDEKTEARTESMGELEIFPLSEAEEEKVFSLNADLTEEQKA